MEPPILCSEKRDQNNYIMSIYAFPVEKIYIYKGGINIVPSRLLSRPASYINRPILA